MKVKLTCATCYRSQTLDADTQVEGIGVAAWWTDLRYHSCAECFAHTCWEPVDSSVCFADKGHPGHHLPWKDSYGEVCVDAEPILNLWAP